MLSSLRVDSIDSAEREPFGRGDHRTQVPRVRISVTGWRNDTRDPLTAPTNRATAKAREGQDAALGAALAVRSQRQLPFHVSASRP